MGGAKGGYLYPPSHTPLLVLVKGVGSVSPLRYVIITQQYLLAVISKHRQLFLQGSKFTFQKLRARFNGYHKITLGSHNPHNYLSNLRPTEPIKVCVESYINSESESNSVSHLETC